MNIRKFIPSLALMLIFFAFANLVLSDASDKTKKPAGKGSPSNLPTPGSSSGSSLHASGPSQGGLSQGGLSSKDSAEKMPLETQLALEEIKSLSSMLDKKTTVNRNLIISTAVTNMIMLMILSGVVGFKVKKSKNSDDDKGDKDKDKDKDNSDEGDDSDDS
ncbi:sexual stage-specific protein precursor [Plasmodium gaboni]|uniref:Sexual stage-specific protein n=1 Tax=Plasmodium gaboni TaxID=647221 RepID=A0A151LUB5_9APIC|nr:sexual stage-specific protein precursor [Plasmodium gaboni]KYO02771.1 sexual stage-specific protein precursor [Plasmodium gaboni]SOV11184.1 sexual stage-specific protein precursor [Plasmodium gaboni]SOV21038.1 sexual stage-specific protein precursor [Plasmodium sp. DRC-Itaito]